MDRREPPDTAEGWYALHDFRSVDWDAWRDASRRERERVITEGVEFLESAVDVHDADEGASAVYSVLGTEADLLLLHLRPETADVDALKRRFERTELARFTDRTDSYVSVTEASGYTDRAREFFEGDLDEDSGLAKYIRSRLEPTLPDDEHLCFYPMSKRRDPEYNWYDLPFDERREHMEAHGEVGREYGGKVSQMITASTGFEDYEWGVTLFAGDATEVKDLLYEMRFDPSTSKYAEFGPFYLARRIEPHDLQPLLDGEPVPAEESGSPYEHAHPHTHTYRHSHEHEHEHEHEGEDEDEVHEHEHVHTYEHSHPHPHEGGDHEHGHAGDHEHDHEAEHGHDHRRVHDHDHDHEQETDHGHDDGDHGHEHEHGNHEDTPDHGEGPDSGGLGETVRDLGVELPADLPEDAHGLVLHSTAPQDELAGEVDGLRGNFEHYDSHLLTEVVARDDGAAIVSLWANEGAADTAAGFLEDLPGVEEREDGPVRGETAGADDATESTAVATDAGDDIRGTLADQDIYAGQPHGEDVYAMVLYSAADVETLSEAVDDLRGNFEHYDTHVKTAVYRPAEIHADADETAVVSIWDTEDAAETASDFLADLPEITRQAGDDDETWGTMGMFYTVRPDYREEFVGKFETVGDLLADMDGHVRTTLMVNHEDENDAFIASRWDSQDDAMAFFRSDDFADTVDWGRDALADRPRHVFLA
jgi:chlorite dismutase/heme-degrading monooxygenase HmoA